MWTGAESSLDVGDVCKDWYCLSPSPCVQTALVPPHLSAIPHPPLIQVIVLGLTLQITSFPYIFEWCVFILSVGEVLR